MRLFSCIAFALFLAAPPLTAYAAEPESPDALIGQTDAVRASIQERLSAKFTNASEARKSEQGALVEYYSIAENCLLWVDDNGLNDRAKAVMEEIGKADDYGLRPADYPLPKVGVEENPAVELARRCRDQDQFRRARLCPRRARRPYRSSGLQPNLDPDLVLPDPLEVMESIAIRSDPAAYLAELPARPAPVRSLRQALIELAAGMSTTRTSCASPTARR